MKYRSNFLIVTVLLMFCVFSSQTVYAKDKNKSYRKVEVFASTSGELLSVTMNLNIHESCKSMSKTKAKFTSRWASATSLVVATHTRPQIGVSYKPRHESSSGKVLKNFSPWKTKSFIIPSDQRLFFGKSNGTDVTYAKTTKNRERFSCFIFVSDAPIMPRRTCTITMSLKY